MIFKKEKMCQVYPHASKINVLKFKVRSMVRTSINLFTIALVASGALWVVYGEVSHRVNAQSVAINPETTQEVLQEVKVDTLVNKVDELKEDVLNQLKACESAGHSEDAGLIVFDDNKAGTLSAVNKASIGQFQFKVTTVQNFEKLRSGKVLTNKEATLLALDTEKARDLAKWVIFEQKGGIFHWLNCSNKHGLAEQVTLIKKLQ